MLSIHICIYYTYQYIIHVNIHIFVENGKIEYIQMNHGETNIYIYTHNYIHMCIVSWFVWICMVYKDERGATEDILCGDAFAG